MDNCPECGGHHEAVPPALQAWFDQFEAEFRETARNWYSRWLAQQQIVLVLDEETLRAAYDPILEAGGNAMLEILSRRGCLKREELPDGF